MIGLGVLAFIAIVGKTSKSQDTKTTDRSAIKTAAEITAAPMDATTAIPTNNPTASPTTAPTSTPIPTATPTPAPTEIPTLKKGSTGPEVKKLQQALIDEGYLKGTADGDFGDKTRQAVKDFQLVNNLTEDGVAGPSTLNRLYSYYCRSNRTVYVSNNNVYHGSSTCSGMKKYTTMTLVDAIRKGCKMHENCN